MSEDENLSGSGSDTEKEKPKKKKVKKGKKDKSDGPKRPPSAYMYFAQKMRPVLKDENPDANFAQIGRLLGDKWKELSAEEKKPYEALNKEAKAKYIEEGGNEGKKRKKAGSGVPKKPLSGFMFFSKELRPIIKGENPDIKFSEMGKQLGEQWKNLMEDEKKKYNDMNKADKERYTEEFEKWKEEHPEEAAALKSKKKKPNNKNKKPKKKAAKKKKKDDDEDDEGGEDEGNGEEVAEEPEAEEEAEE